MFAIRQLVDFSFHLYLQDNLANDHAGMFCYVYSRAVLCAQSLSRVQLFAAPWTVAHQAPLSMGILQARILEWVAMLSSRGSSEPRDGIQVAHTAGRFFTS